MAYVDGFVLVVPKKNRTKYKKMANDYKSFWMKRGALDYKECLLSDAKALGALSFPKMAKARKGEDVWFSYVVYKNKQHSDKVNREMMATMKAEAKKGKKMEMPFDMKRMAYGGFTVEVG